MKTRREIKDRILKLADDKDSFMDSDYSFNGESERLVEYFDSYKTAQTLEKLINWIFEDETDKDKTS